MPSCQTRLPPRARAGAVVVAVLCLLGAGCSGGKKKEAASTTTQPEPTTSTAPALARNASPLTRLPGNPAAAARAALAAKTDNAPKARPQAGINAAGIVVEEGAEGGVTRHLTLF